MNLTIYILWALGAAVYSRGSRLAQGKSKNKLFAKESFLLLQKAAAVIFALSLALAIASANKYLIYLFICNLIVTFLFYLQPTPRTTTKLMYVFILLNAIFLAIILI